MDKNKIVCIGTGGAGGKLLDVLMDIDPRYTPVFCNTNINEMEVLNNYNPTTNSLYIAGASGSGRDSKVAKELILGDKARVISYFQSRFSESSGIDTFFIITSGDGGSGSGSVSILSQVIKKNVNPDATVNLLIAAPKLTEKGYSITNFKRLYKDIQKLIEGGIINSYQFIDNNKMHDEEEFNYAVMKEFDDSLSINSIEIDPKDSARVNNAPGYKVTLNLESKYKPLKLAIDNAIKNSNFILPEHLECDHMIASIDEDTFNKDKLDSLFTVYDLVKTDYNCEERNIIVLGGCDMPNSYMELIEEAEINLKVAKEERRKSRNGFYNFSIDEDEEVAATKKDDDYKEVNKKRKRSRKDFIKMLNESELW